MVLSICISPLRVEHPYSRRGASWYSLFVSRRSASSILIHDAERRGTLYLYLAAPRRASFFTTRSVVVLSICISPLRVEHPFSRRGASWYSLFVSRRSASSILFHDAERRGTLYLYLAATRRASFFTTRSVVVLSICISPLRVEHPYSRRGASWYSLFVSRRSASSILIHDAERRYSLHSRYSSVRAPVG